jgi:hypothetical protein
MGRGRGQSVGEFDLGDIERFGVMGAHDLTPSFTPRIKKQLSAFVRLIEEDQKPDELLSFLAYNRWLLEPPRRLDVEVGLVRANALMLLDGDKVETTGIANRYLAATCGVSRASRLFVSEVELIYTAPIKLIHLREDTEISKTLCTKEIMSTWQRQHSFEDWNNESRFKRCPSCLDIASKSPTLFPFGFEIDGYLSHLSEDEVWEVEASGVEVAAESLISSHYSEGGAQLATAIRPKVYDAAKEKLSYLSAARFLSLSPQERLDLLFGLDENGTGGLWHGDLAGFIREKYQGDLMPNEWPDIEKMAEIMRYSNLEPFPSHTEERMNENRFRAGMVAELWPDIVYPRAKKILDKDEERGYPGAMEIWRANYPHLLGDLI